ncbi:MAG: hypothetical protein M5R36_06835 [Deltaproteobacteria bacterium]|nr:hypothetical protein [Deltaproteobacteria bacterium]
MADDDDSRFEGLDPDEIEDAKRVLAAERETAYLDPGARRLTAIVHRRDFVGEFRGRRWNWLVAGGFATLAGVMSVIVHRDTPALGPVLLTVAAACLIYALAGIRRFRVEPDGSFSVRVGGRFEMLSPERMAFAMTKLTYPAFVYLSDHPSGSIAASYLAYVYPFNKDGRYFLFLGTWSRVSDGAYVAQDILTSFLHDWCARGGMTCEATTRFSVKEGGEWIARRGG